MAKAPKNPLFNLKKFQGKTLKQIGDDIRANWYKYGHCKVCGKMVPNKNVRHWLMLRMESGTCCQSCKQMEQLVRLACCDKCEILPTFAYYAETDCPVHGRKCFGTSD